MISRAYISEGYEICENCVISITGKGNGEPLCNDWALRRYSFVMAAFDDK